jgi:hypothetical protein
MEAGRCSVQGGAGRVVGALAAGGARILRQRALLSSEVQWRAELQQGRVAPLAPGMLRRPRACTCASLLACCLPGWLPLLQWAVFERRRRNLEAAEACFQRAVALAPGNPHIWCACPAVQPQRLVLQLGRGGGGGGRGRSPNKAWPWHSRAQARRAVARLGSV